MAHRAVITQYGFMQSSGVAGTFELVSDCQFFDDTNTHIPSANIVVPIVMSTMTGAQIQTAIINAIISTGASMGYTLVAGANQIIIPQMNRV